MKIELLNEIDKIKENLENKYRDKKFEKELNEILRANKIEDLINFGISKKWEILILPNREVFIFKENKNFSLGRGSNNNIFLSLKEALIDALKETTFNGNFGVIIENNQIIDFFEITVKEFSLYKTNWKKIYSFFINNELKVCEICKLKDNQNKCICFVVKGKYENYRK